MAHKINPKYYHYGCSSPTKRPDESCYQKCSNYKNWHNVITQHIDKFDTTPFDAEKAIKEINNIEGIDKRLTYWIDNYFDPLYLWIIKLNHDSRDILINYQSRLKYCSSSHRYNVSDAHLLTIPQIIFNTFFEGHEQTSDFFYVVIRHSAKLLLYGLLKNDSWSKKLNAPKPSAIRELKKYLNELQAKEDRAEQLYNDNEICNIYSNDYHFKNYNKEKKDARLFLRIKYNYYKDNAPSSYDQDFKFDIFRLYAEHIYLKEFLKKELIKLEQGIESSPQQPPTIDENTKEILPKQTEKESFQFTNNFDDVNRKKVHSYFQKHLVHKNYLTEEQLREFLTLAFDKEEPPKQKLIFKNSPGKQKIYTIFFKYYSDEAGKKYGKQKEYAKLLGEYFEDYKTDTVYSNFAR